MKFFDPKKKPESSTPVFQPARTADVEVKPSAVPPSNPAPLPVTPAAPGPQAPVVEAPVALAPVVPRSTLTSVPQPSVQPEPKPVPAPSKSTGKSVLGPSITIRGDVVSEENLIIEGVVDGSVETTRDLLVGPEGKVHATIRATNVIIQGTVIGDVMATNKVDLTASGILQGNIYAPRLTIAETALFKGNIDMRPRETSSSTEKERRQEKTR